MNKTMTIEEFHALLTTESERDGSPLLTALHKLTAIEEPEGITVLAEEDAANWQAWEEV